MTLAMTGMGIVEASALPVGESACAGSRPAGHIARRRVLPLATLRVALLAAGLTAAAALGVPAPAIGAETPEGLNDRAVSITRSHAEGPVVWARYVETTPETAARLLGTSRSGLFEGLPDRVYLVVMRGDFRLASPMPPPGVAGGEGDERGSYLAFLYWHDGDSWSASDFTLLQRPVSLESAGEPEIIESFALSHPTLTRAWEYALAGLYVFLPAVLLVVSAILTARHRHSRSRYLFAACAALAAAAWQALVMLRSVAGQSWDPTFHGVKLGVLVVVVSVDLAAALLLLRARSRLDEGDGSPVEAPRPVSVGILLLVLAAVLHVVSLPWLLTTGA